MTYLKIIFVLTVMMMSGCTTKPTPYKVVDSLNYKKGYMSGFYKEGITEEIIDLGKNYKLTVKLDSSSSKKRAEDMLLFHAAKLTVASGAESFSIHKKRSSIWCSYTNNKENTSKIVKNYGPSFYMFFSINPSNKSTESTKSIRKNQHIAVDIIAKVDERILISEPEEVVKVNRKESYAHCNSRR